MAAIAAFTIEVNVGGGTAVNVWTWATLWSTSNLNISVLRADWYWGKNSFSFVLSVEHLSDCRLSAVLCLFVPVSLQLLKHFFCCSDLFPQNKPLRPSSIPQNYITLQYFYFSSSHVMRPSGSAELAMILNLAASVNFSKWHSCIPFFFSLIQWWMKMSLFLQEKQRVSLVEY